MVVRSAAQNLTYDQGVRHPGEEIVKFSHSGRHLSSFVVLVLVELDPVLQLRLICSMRLSRTNGNNTDTCETGVEWQGG